MDNERLHNAELSSMNLYAVLKRGDPYRYYHFLRSTDPIHWEAHVGGWLCTRYSDVITGLKDKRLSAERPVPQRAVNPPGSPRLTFESLERCLRLWMVFREPPQHSMLRDVCNQGFTQAVIDNLRPQIEAVINDLFDQFPHDGTLDLVESLAYPLPTRVMCPLFGIDPEDVPFLERCSDQIAEAFGTGNLTLKAAEAYEEMVRYFRNLLNNGRATAHALGSAMLEAQETGTLGSEEILANCVFLLLAGRDTTTNFIGNSIFTLVKNPDQLELLRSDRSLMSLAVEELLRFESPVQHVYRAATEDFEIGRCKIRKHEQVLLSIGAANRDIAQFAEPDKVNIGRRNNRHLAFVTGVHYCLGARLARLEGQLVLDALIDRFRTIELADEHVEWKNNVALRGLKTLKVRVLR